MIKYLFCILVSIVLVSCNPDTSRKHAQKPQEKTEVMTQDMQTYARHHRCTGTSLIAQSCNNNHWQNFRNGISASKVKEGILNSLVFFRKTFPSRVLKYDAGDITLEIFSSLHFQVSERERRFFSPTTNSIKYSLRYYIYTLRHILI